VKSMASSRPSVTDRDLDQFERWTAEFGSKDNAAVMDVPAWQSDEPDTVSALLPDAPSGGLSMDWSSDMASMAEEADRAPSRRPAAAAGRGRQAAHA